MNRGRAATTGLGVVPALALALAACSAQPTRTAQAPADPGPHPVVAVSQAERILDTVDATLAQAAGDPAAAGPRVAGPYKQILGAQVKARHELGKAAPGPVAPGGAGERTRLVIPLGTGWPRFFVSVTSAPTQGTPLMRVLVCSDARAPYALWGELTMLPGATLPGVAPAEQGAPAPSQTPGGRQPAPAAAIDQYAHVLSKGTDSRFSAQFARSPFTDHVLARTAADRKALAKVATVQSTHTAVPGTVYALGTADGGSLVIGVIKQSVTISIKRGSGTVKVSDPQVAALAGRSRFAKRINRTAMEVVALLVPPHGPLTVVAAEKADVAITGS